MSGQRIERLLRSRAAQLKIALAFLGSWIARQARRLRPGWPPPPKDK